MSKKDKTAKDKAAKKQVVSEPVAKAAGDAVAESHRAIVLISRALADPTRIELLRRIADVEGTSCMDLRTCLAMNPATLSHHMRQLEGAGLIETHRDGKLVRATLRRKVWKGYIADIKAYLGG